MEQDEQPWWKTQSEEQHVGEVSTVRGQTQYKTDQSGKYSKDETSW